MRLAGLVSIFDKPVPSDKVPLIPVICSMRELFTDLSLDYLIVDLHESGNNLHVILAMLRARPGIRLLVIGGHIHAPRSVLSKLIDRLLNVSDSSLTNAPLQLTSRENEVIELIMLAQSNREIARSLGIRVQTVTAHVGRLMRKTGTDNRINLASFMRERRRSVDRGIFPVPHPRTSDTE